MGKWSIGPKGLIVLSIHTVDRYLLGIALLWIWLGIMRNLWNSWTLIPSFCLFLAWLDSILTCPLRTNLHRSCLRWIHPFLELGSCSLDPVYSAFQKGVKQLFQEQVPSLTSNSEGSGELPQKKGTFDLDHFFIGIHSFFKLSSARCEDYTFLESVTGVVAEYAKKHAETRWVSMKYELSGA